MLSTILLWISCCTISTLAQEATRYFPETPIGCSLENNCPAEWPCCSQFGQCGTGPFCVGGCNPRLSHDPGSCLGQPALLPRMSPSFWLQSSLEQKPALKSSFLPRVQPSMDVASNEGGEKDLNNRGIVNFANFLISPQERIIKKMLRDYHFTYSGFVKYDAPGQLTLAMPKHTSGSLISSTRSFLYGRATVKMKTARGRGVVTAVVLISTVGDEIDFEFIGGELHHAQSNYYHQGELNHTRMEKLELSSDSFENIHIYEVDWDQDRINWIVDGVVARTLYKEDTWNEEKQRYEYPQTPMRLQVSVWPGGREDADPGTIMWAGGLIDWENSPDILEKGQFYATVESIAVTPYENKFWPSIVDELERLHLPIDANSLLDITYDYNYDKFNEHTWFEDSVIWKKGKLPYLSSLDKNGLNPGRQQQSLLVGKQLKQEQGDGPDQSPSNRFIQDTNKPSEKNHEEQDLLLRNALQSRDATTNGGSSHNNRNPIKRLLNMLH